MTTRRILVIDDEADIREVTQLSLEICSGWEVLTAASGWEGLATAQAEQPDAILLDMMMPEIDGKTTYQNLQKNPTTKNIPVILLTAKVEAVQQHQYQQLGVTAVLTKPFEPARLANQIARALGWEES